MLFPRWQYRLLIAFVVVAFIGFVWVELDLPGSNLSGYYALIGGLADFAGIIFALLLVAFTAESTRIAKRQSALSEDVARLARDADERQTVRIEPRMAYAARESGPRTLVTFELVNAGWKDSAIKRAVLITPHPAPTGTRPHRPWDAPLADNERDLEGLFRSERGPDQRHDLMLRSGDYGRFEGRIDASPEEKGTRATLRVEPVIGNPVLIPLTLP